MTKQAIFNKVVTHLLTQNTQAITDEQCAYRGSNGTKCAIGCLISNKNYKKRMEGCDINDLNIKGLFPLHLVPYLNFLHPLQLIHDSYIVSYWPLLLANFAEEENLKTPKILADALQLKMEI